MTIRTQIVPDPPPGVDWSTVVPGEYLWDVLTVTATLEAVGGCASFNPNTAMDPSPSAGVGFFSYVDLVASAFDPGAGPFTLELWSRWADNGVPVGQVFAALDPGFDPGEPVIDMSGAPTAGYAIQIAVPVHQLLGVASAVPPGDTGWHHVVYVCTGSGGTLEIFEDGASLGSLALTPYAIGPIFANELGAGAHFPPAQGCSTPLDEVALYHSALSPAQIAAHYAAMCVGFADYSAAVLADSPVSYYHLDEPPGATTVSDATGNNNGGIVQGNPTFGIPGAVRGGGPRYPALTITDGANVILVAPSATGQVNGTTVQYSWYLANASSIPTPGTGIVSIALPRLVLPAGYVVESVTGELEPADQWTEITVWWDDTLMDGMAGITPYDYNNILIVP